MADILYTIIIFPLTQIIELVYQTGQKLFENSGLSIICVSIAVTFLCLPLYIVAEKWQRLERDLVRRMKPKIDNIKAVFKGDEQYMILSAYYRQNHYHPVYALRNSFGILVQIPFFIAAYSFLSHLETLKGISFFFIRDLGQPDGLLSIGNIQINILPVLMTGINCIAGTIYTQKLYLRDKIQGYGMAAIFLVLLYHSPAGLVFYWTMNNIFSLIKNIFYLLKRPLLTLYILLCGAVVMADIFLLFFHHGDIFNRLILAIAALIIPLAPLVVRFINVMFSGPLRRFNTEHHKRTALFILSSALVCLLTGFVIPSYIIQSSPQEFSYIESLVSPFAFLINSFSQALGFFLFWPLCIYFLFGNKIKSLLTIAVIFLGWYGLINAFCFSGEYGELSAMLTFTDAGIIKPSWSMGIVNAGIALAIAAVIFLFIVRNFTKVIFAVSSIIVLALAGISIAHSITIGREFRRYTAIRAGTEKTEMDASPIFHLSKDGENIIVIMLDRAVNAFVPEIFSESPVLYEQFAGFTWYPNTVSFNHFTLMGAPPLFGGYEYTPDSINKRTNEGLVKKHNEALLLMPRIFLEHDFSVTVTDPSWANYSWIPDTRIYSAYPEIKARNTIRSYTDIWLSKNNFSNLQLKSKTLKRNFIWFSFFKTSPLVLRDAVYNNGDWWSTDSQAIDFRLILNNYAVLDFLPVLTDTQSSKQNTFTLFVNELTHEPAFLQAPDYVPSPNVTDRGKSKYADIVNYPSNAAALKRLGSWFDRLKQNGVYDNTRIIIAADHGADINSGAFDTTQYLPFNPEAFNPLLLVKDFDSHFPLRTDTAFMTNADVPSLAFENIISNPVNPFTGTLINNSAKQDILKIAVSDKWMPYEHNPNTFKVQPGEWWSVTDTIFDTQNWKKINP